MPSAMAAPRETSNWRPLMKGPRSLMRTVTVLPLARFTKRTFVPNGRDLCAAVSPFGLKRSPEAVLVP